MSTRDLHHEDAGREPPSADVQAAEYVLGVQDAPERLATQRRIETDPGFARLVQEWERRLSPWLRGIVPVEVPPHVWPRLRLRLEWAPVEEAGRRPWHSIGFWRAATGVALAAAVGAIAIGLRRPMPEAPTPPVVIRPPVAEEPAARPVTVLAREDGSAGWIATINATDGKLLMVPVPSPADPQGRVNELWVIPAGQAPVSLGLVSHEQAHTIEVPEPLRRALAPGATLAITLEPAEGIPHPAPSGPVVASGSIERI